MRSQEAGKPQGQGMGGREDELNREMETPGKGGAVARAPLGSHCCTWSSSNSMMKSPVLGVSSLLFFYLTLHCSFKISFSIFFHLKPTHSGKPGQRHLVSFNLVEFCLSGTNGPEYSR